MHEEPIADLAARLRFVLDNMYTVLESFDATPPPDRREVRVRVERWTQALESIIAQADAYRAPVPAAKALLADALSGRDVSADAAAMNLHDLTQIAAVLRPSARLLVFNAELLSVLEQASIATAKPGQVEFRAGDAA